MNNDKVANFYCTLCANTSKLYHLITYQSYDTGTMIVPSLQDRKPKLWKVNECDQDLS